MTYWTFQPIFGSYLAVLLLSAAMLALLVIRPAYARPSPGRWRVLQGLRLMVILLIALAMLRPTRVSSSSTPQRGVLLVLFDKSRSMQLPHGTGGESRWDAQSAALAAAAEVLPRLSDQLDVKLYGYDRELLPVDLQRLAPSVKLSPDGQETDLGSTLYDAVQRELGKRLAGVILLGDGAQNVIEPRVELPRATRQLARLGFPLYTVTFGPAGDVAQSRDIAVENLPERYTVFAKNRLQVKGAVRVRGYANQAVPVELRVEPLGGEPARVGPVTITAREGDELLPVQIPLTAGEPGEYRVTLRAAPQTGEIVVRNNELSAFLTVLEGGIRVLYVYGDLFGEQRLLRESIGASPDLQLDELWVDPRQRDRWPLQLGEMVSLGEFDVVMLENVNAAAFEPADWTQLAEAVERGSGLLMIGGFHSFGPGGYQRTPLVDVLPVEMGRFEKQDLRPTAPVSRDLHLWGDVVMLPTRPHPVTRLAPEGDNVSLWKTLPALRGANRIRAKQSGTVLAETPDGAPLLVSGAYGDGRVLAFAGNTTIRWWQFGRQDEHRRFWRQTVLWLARREDLNTHDLAIKLAQRRFHPRADIPFEVFVRDPTGEELPDAELRVELLAKGGRRQPIKLAKADEGWRGTIADLNEPGDYVIELTARRNEQELGTTRTQFQVMDRDSELSHAAADHERMARMARLTGDAGGRALAPEQLPALLREIESRQADFAVDVQHKWQLGDTAWDAWLFFSLVVALVSCEWVLRKRWGLV